MFIQEVTSTSFAEHFCLQTTLLLYTVWIIMNNSLINIHVQIFCVDLCFIYFGNIARNWTYGSYSVWVGLLEVDWTKEMLNSLVD